MISQLGKSDEVLIGRAKYVYFAEIRQPVPRM